MIKAEDVHWINFKWSKNTEVSTSSLTGDVFNVSEAELPQLDRIAILWHGPDVNNGLTLLWILIPVFQIFIDALGNDEGREVSGMLVIGWCNRDRQSRLNNIKK